jgi:hypothetical protein
MEPEKPEGRFPLILTTSFDSSTETFGFEVSTLSEVVYTDGTFGTTDPALGAKLTVSDQRILTLPHVEHRGRGEFIAPLDPNAVDEQRYVIQPGAELLLMQGEIVLLSANLDDGFLFIGGNNGFDSEFQQILINVQINNTIGSRYLQEIQDFLDRGGNHYVCSSESNLLDATGQLTTSGESSSQSRLFGFPPTRPVGGTTSFLTDGSGSSAGSIALLAGGVAAVVAIIAAGGWYTRRRWLNSRS